MHMYIISKFVNIRIIFILLLINKFDRTCYIRICTCKLICRNFPSSKCKRTCIQVHVLCLSMYNVHMCMFLKLSGFESFLVPIFLHIFRRGFCFLESCSFDIAHTCTRKSKISMHVIIQFILKVINTLC